MKKPSKKIFTFSELKRTYKEYVCTFKIKIATTITFSFVINFNSLCFAQKNLISLGIGTGIGVIEEPSIVLFGNVMYNFNKRLSAGFEFNTNSEGFSLADGRPLFARGTANGFLGKVKYHFKDKGTRFFTSIMAGVYNVQYIINDENPYGSTMWGYKIPKQNLLGFGLEGGVRFRIFQLSAVFHHTEFFKYDMEFVYDSNGNTATRTFNTQYSMIQINVGWNFGIF